ncbi:P2R1A-PPP2R2A-interacting phosphatase regulator 1-like isoform X2 [Dreissena polymorpha]|uniref:P2R1A-PPP2R2A-interacting phosphatase regulator 1-like isoform X2 n=1 Tax=Dreissena polymorpha TaxID=45954 RepID=UPI002264CD47|nr:P2R1A-PPP2R2A-interacting phosphatase regulator 1-like isoform X2 [Dreissena polymorpha]
MENFKLFKMEVDPPSMNNMSTPIHGQNNFLLYNSRDLESAMNCNSFPAPGALKRSSSAPMIHVLVSSASLEISPPNTFTSADSQRTRRFSSSSMTLHNSALTPVKVADRLNQLKQEESDIAVRDMQKEREIRSAIQISATWNEKCNIEEPMIAEITPRRPRSFSESLHIFTSPCMIVGAPSPTRTGKQCFSPSMQQPIKNHIFTPSPSPSPTRRSFSSISPITSGTLMRPSPLGKRKLEPDGDNRFESYMSPPKRFHTGPSTPDRLLPHPLAHSVSSSSCDSNSSPEQSVSSASSIHLPLGSGMQHNMFFMPLHDTQDMQTTDSETSDVTESTDMSEVGDTSHGMLLTTSQSPRHIMGFTSVKSTHL